MEAFLVPRGSFGHFDAGKAGGDDTAVDDQEQTAEVFITPAPLHQTQHQDYQSNHNVQDDQCFSGTELVCVQCTVGECMYIVITVNYGQLRVLLDLSAIAFSIRARISGFFRFSLPIEYADSGLYPARIAA